MGCFLSCFRAGRDQSGHLRDPLVRESRLGEAFLDDEKKHEVSGALEENSGNDGGVDEELRREANYLKSCGTISQTPPEILKVSSPTSSEKANECNDTFTNVQVMKETTLLEAEGNLSEVFNSDEHDILKGEQNIDEGTLRVESEPRSSLQPSCQNVTNQRTGSSDSPYPTPLVLRGEIQTPGTIYTGYKGTLKSGKRARASRQFIYPVLRPIENKMQWMEARMDSPVLSSNPPKRRYLSAESSEQSQETFASSTAKQTESSKSVSFPSHDNCPVQDKFISPEENKGQNGNQQALEGGEVFKQDSEYGKHGVSSLSHWLKPSSADGESRSDTDGYEKSVFDVPIFPAFGLNWDSENPTPVLPKAWDGNGIPNTTTKYKEDQIVSWHATPFEERLMKVLSDEKPPRGRNISGKLIHLEENAE